MFMLIDEWGDVTLVKNITSDDKDFYDIYHMISETEWTHLVFDNPSETWVPVEIHESTE